MKIEIESIIYGFGNPNMIYEFNRLIAVIKDIKFIQFDVYFKYYESEYFFLYKGGNHIAVHQKTINGNIMGERLLFCKD